MPAKVAYITCPFKPLPEEHVIAMPGADDRPPSNACVQHCQLYMRTVGDDGKVSPGGTCAFALGASALFELAGKLAAVQIQKIPGKEVPPPPEEPVS